MRSNSLIPLYQIIDWLGIDPFYFNGIDTSIVVGSSLKNKKDCPCVLKDQNSDGHLARELFVSALLDAERLFIDEARFYPVNYQILRERKEVNDYNTFKPKYSGCFGLDFGIRKIIYLFDIPLVRADDSNEILDEFYADFTLPAEYELKNVRIYFKGFKPVDYNDHLYEIRPINLNQMTNGTIRLSGHAALFKDPDLDDEDQCLPHDFSTYVESVSVYVSLLDISEQGYLKSKDSCSTSIFAEDIPIMIDKKIIGDNDYGVITNTQLYYDTTGVLSSRKLCVNFNNVSEVNYNYTTGDTLAIGGYVDRKYVTTMTKLMIGFMSCFGEVCKCSHCTSRKIEKYSSVPKFMIEADNNPGELSNRYMPLVTDKQIQALNGLTPTQGILEGMREIQRYRCNTYEGSWI